MINLHELRIGNLVCLNRNTDKPWIRIDKDEMEVLCAARNYDWYDPIPLTPEILEKCGFVKSGVYRKNILIQSALDLDYQLYCYFCREEDPKDDSIGIGVTNDRGRVILAFIFHLHQLQNLYFALTGKELNINL